MKGKYLFFILVIIGFVFSSCDKSDFEYEDNFKKSHKSWLDFKNKSDNSYVYTTSAGTWVGASWETTITVDNGEIVQRSFKYTWIKEGLIPSPELELEWTENKGEINSHKNTAAWQAMTLDDVYDMAKQDWLQKRKDASTLLETKNDGLISSCGYYFDNCADDCFRGISIIKIAALK